MFCTLGKNICLQIAESRGKHMAAKKTYNYLYLSWPSCLCPLRLGISTEIHFEDSEVIDVGAESFGSSTIRVK